jgi:hypothetical protein
VLVVLGGALAISFSAILFRLSHVSPSTGGFYALEHGAYGSNPQLGALYGVLTGLAYTGFLVALRATCAVPRGRCSTRRRRPQSAVR